MEKIMTSEQICRNSIENGTKHIRVKYLDGTTETIRAFIARNHGNEICRFRRRSKRYGYPLNFSQIAEVKPVLPRKTKEEKWRDGWLKIKSRLEKSGLWGNLIPDIDTALEIGYETLQKAYSDYWNISYKENEQDVQLAEFEKKYPKLCYKNDRGKIRVNTTILWYMSKLPKVKKMQFERKELNDAILKQIQKAIDEKQEHHASGQKRYDVSFEYRPDKEKAWYSEEFRGCGNGHYYLALDATHAVFWEDD
jgi:hypothetical protein